MAKHIVQGPELEHWPVTQLGHAHPAARHQPSVAGANKRAFSWGFVINIASPGQNQAAVQSFNAPSSLPQK